MTLQIQVKRVCSKCLKDKTRETPHKLKSGIVKKYPNWVCDGQGGYLCKDCYDKVNERRRNRYKTRGPRRITFKDKRIVIPYTPRNGVCNLCRAVVGEINAQTGKRCRTSNRAHISYHDDDPLKDTLEMCASCHTTHDHTGEGRTCYFCGSTETANDSEGYPRWLRVKEHNGEFQCSRCYEKASRKKRRLIR